ncbi:hypothetical protein [Mariniphaga sp.]|uniref:hypothetical protein n=1 Tax=Mariniphaga sp. TaxID=1954475 RepID=UPI003569194E
MKTKKKRFFKAWKKLPSLLTIQKWNVTRYIAVFLAAATLNLTQGCYYFKVNAKSNPSAETISSLESQGKNFYLHFNEKVLRLANVEIRDSTLLGEIGELGDNYINYQVKPDKPNRYYKKLSKRQTYLLNEVHIYTNEYADLGNKMVSIPLSSVSKVEIYDKDTATTTGSWVLGVLGAGAIAFVILVILVLIFKESCPFIYAYDGDSYQFAGEIFSGAIQPGLERHDYLALSDLKPVEGQYLMKVTNEVKEIQHINLLELAMIDHPENVNVLMDKYGQVQTFSEPVLPEKAEAFDGQDVLFLINEKDENAFIFNDISVSDEHFAGVVFTFIKPENATNGKLMIRAKNSVWVEHVFSSFHDMFGGRYYKFNKREEKKSSEKLRELMFNQGFPLAVYLENEGEWELQDFYEIAGPMAMKNDILAIDLKDVKSDTLKIKLETGLMFWEMDFAAMDFTENIPLEVKTVTALEAMDENGFDVVDAIKNNDLLYYSQPEIGNEATLIFPVPEFTDENRTVILHSKGYYKIIREQEGRADWKTLKSFRDPGRMAQYSRELYEEFISLSQKMNSNE